MSEQNPQLDLTKISFPTDRLSIKDLRNLFPEKFDMVDGRVQFSGFGRVGDDLEATLQLERHVARSVFDAAMGRASSIFMASDPLDAKEMLAQSFIEYRLASGPHHAEQLVRNIEEQAVDQAKAFGKSVSI